MASMSFSIGDKAKINKSISKASYFLYQDYKTKSNYIICPCSLKGRLVEVKKVLNNGILLCTYKDTVITVIYSNDLSKVSN